MGIVKSNILERVGQNLNADESTVLYRQRKRTALSDDFKELLLLLEPIEGSGVSQIRGRTKRVIKYIGEWNPSFPMSGKLSTELKDLFNELHSIRLERVENKIRVHEKKSTYAKANDIANKLVRLLFLPLGRKST
jgi:hypothetical protein